ncbi:MAG: flagellar basal body P-ring protein FlgI [Planctomycetota bacterium]
MFQHPSSESSTFRAAEGIQKPQRSWLTSMPMAVSCLLISTVLCGCASGLMSMPGAGLMANRFSKDKKTEETDSEKKESRRKKAEDNDFGNKVETPLLSEYMSVQGNNPIVLRGVGLVTGLNGTGGDPSPSALRTQLQNEMNRRNIKNSKQILASRDTALVVVTAYLPPMVRKGQRFDVRVALPKNSNATSLKGGWLLETRLFEEQTVEGRGTLKGHEYGVASGAILTNLGVKESGEEKLAELMIGMIPGGAVSMTDRDLSIVIKNDKRGSRNSERVANAVSARFHRYNQYGQMIKCAEAKTDVLVKLKTHEQYINNFPRYQQVIRNIALNETDVARRMRMEMLARDIMEPEKCQLAALQLEAIGDESVPFLKDALDSEHFEVRFQAAQSLAYLGNGSGVSILREAAIQQPAFRVYALVSMSVIDDADAVLALRELMSAESLETRYGAFRALKELDSRDPFLNPIVFEPRFVVYLIDSEGEPMVHVTRRRAPEVVLFGADQPLRLPAVLNAGRNIRVIGESGSDHVEMTYYKLNAEPERQQVPNRLIDIIRAAGNLGATYPDVVQMLIEAEQQGNFVGRFGIDRLPQAGRLYVRDDTELSAEDGRTIGTNRMLPELFDELDEEELKENESEEKLMSLDFKEVEAEAARKSERTGTPKVESNAADTGEKPSDVKVGKESTEAAETSTNEDFRTSAAASSDEPSESETKVGDSPGRVTEESGEAELSESVDSGKPGFAEKVFGRMKRPFSGLSEPEGTSE